MGLFNGAKRTKIRYLIELPHGPYECQWVMDEIIGRGSRYTHLFRRGCHVGEHRAWALPDGTGRQEVIEEALPMRRALAARTPARGRPAAFCPPSEVCYTPPP
jgi:hypothetical protein